MGEQNEKFSYMEALTEVDRILNELRGENIDIDTLTVRVERAAKLIELCKERLFSATEEVKKLVN